MAQKVISLVNGKLTEVLVSGVTIPEGHIFRGRALARAGSLFLVSAATTVVVLASSGTPSVEINGRLVANSNSQIIAESGSSILIKAV